MAECPFCGELLGPNDFLPGKGAVCPRCGNRIAAPALARPSAPSAPAAPRPAAPPAKRTVAAKKPAPVVETSPDETAEGDEAEASSSLLAGLRRINGGTLAALIASSTALVLASITPLSFLTKPLSALGLVIGLFAGMLPALMRRKDAILPAAVSVLSLFILLFIGSWPKPPDPPPPPLVAVPLREAGMVARPPVGDDDWVDASVNAVQRDDLRVQVAGVRVGAVELESQGKKSVTTDKYLTIRLAVSLEGIVFQQLPYEPWADTVQAPSTHPPVLTDSKERTYAQKVFSSGRKVVGRMDRNFLTPGRQVNEILIFPALPAKVEYLRLKLPGAAFGARGEFRFQIPRSMIEGY